MTPSHFNKKDILILLGLIWLISLVRTFVYIGTDFFWFRLINFLLIVTPIYYLIYRFFHKQWIRVLFYISMILSAIVGILAFFNPLPHTMRYAMFIKGLFYLGVSIYFIFIKKYPKLEPNKEVKIVNSGKVTRSAKITGILLILLPFITIALFLFGETLVGYITNKIGTMAGTNGDMILAIFSLILSILFLIAIIFLPILFVLGIRYLVRVEPNDQEWDQRSGQGRRSVVPQEIKGWNWAAASLSIIWASYYKLPFVILMRIPLLNFIFLFILGFNGNKWAWKRNKWQSPEQFLQVQRQWRPWGILMFILLVCYFAILLYTVAIYALSPSYGYSPS